MSAPPPPAPRRVHRTDFSTIATHIRGSVDPQPAGAKSGPHPDHFWFRVVNTATGEVLLTTDAFGHANAIAACSSATANARAAWFFRFNRQHLGTGGAKQLTLEPAEARTVMALVTGTVPEDLDALVGRLVAFLGT